MSYRTTTIARQPERTSGDLTFTLKDNLGVAVPLATITSLRVTLYDRSTGTIINSRNNQDVLNANNVTVHATSGLVTWSVQPADMAVAAGSTATYQNRIALFVVKWAADTKERAHEIVIPIENLRLNPPA